MVRFGGFGLPHRERQVHLALYWFVSFSFINFSSFLFQFLECKKYKFLQNLSYFSDWRRNSKNGKQNCLETSWASPLVFYLSGKSFSSKIKNMWWASSSSLIFYLFGKRFSSESENKWWDSLIIVSLNSLVLRHFLFTAFGLLLYLFERG